MTASGNHDNHNDYECDYMKERAERIRKNEEYLASLGLSKVKKNLLDMTKKTKRTLRQEQNLLKRTKIKPGEERRSSRLSSKKKSNSKKQSKHVMLSYDDEDDTHAVQMDSEDDYASDDNHDDHPSPSSKAYPHHPHRRYTRVQPTRKNVELTSQERHVLTQIDDNFLSKFQEFLVYHNKISPPNVRNVMRQVGKLVSGEGIRYESPKYGWPPECVFMKGQKITPMSDFVMLMQEGQDCEDRWGRDHGNGWLLSHPLKKLLLFQQFALNNPDFLTAKCKLVEYYALDDADQDQDQDDNNDTTQPPQELQSSKKEDASASTPSKTRIKKSSPPPQKRKKNSTKRTSKADMEQTNHRVGLRKRRKLL